MNGLPAADHAGRTVAEVLGADAAALTPLVRQALAGDAVRDLDLTTAPVAGSPPRRFRASFVPVRLTESQPGVACVVVETSREREAEAALRITEQRLRLALEGTRTGTWDWDVAADRIAWSAAVHLLHGLEPDATPPTYEEYLQLIHPDDRSALDALVRAAAERGEDYELEFRVVWPDGTVRWLETRAHTITDADGRVTELVGLTSDITERREREIGAELLSRAGLLFAASPGADATLQELGGIVVPELGDWCAITIADEDGSLHTAAVAHVDPSKVRWAREVEQRYPPDPDAPTGVPNVLRTGRSEIYEDIPDELLVAAAVDDEHLRLIRELKMRSALVVPLVARGRTLGALTLVSAESGRRFSSHDLAVAEELGRRAGLAVDNARLYERARDASLTLQRSLLPAHLPNVAGIELAAHYAPGQDGTEVGGDWYDVFAVAGGGAVVAVGDVVGRGLGAAAAMGQLRHAVRVSGFDATDAAGPVERVHRFAAAAGDDLTFATLAFVLLDPDRRRARLCSAGHLPPVIIDPAGNARLADVPPGPPIGAPQTHRGETALDLPPGTTLVLFTDGLVERPDRPLEERLAELVAAAQAPPEALSELLARLVSAMGVEAGRSDDVAIVALRTAR
jgi:PAS domain S-box-containing protein